MSRQKSQVVASIAAMALAALACATLSGQAPSRIGRERAVSHHLKGGDEFRLSIAQLIEHGRTLFCANWTEEDGGGRPLSRGSGAALNDPSHPLRGLRAFNRISGPDANSCQGCHNSPFGIAGGRGDIVTNVVEVTASLRDVLQSIQRGEGLLGAMVSNREVGEATLVDLQHTMANVQQTTRSLEQILERVYRGEGLLGQLTAHSQENEQLLARVNRSVRSLERFTSRLERGQGALVRLVEDDAYARRVLGNLDHALADLADVAGKLDRGQGTLGKLLNDPTLYQDTRALVGRARQSWLLRLLGAGGAAAPPGEGSVPPASRTPEQP